MIDTAVEVSPDTALLEISKIISAMKWAYVVARFGRWNGTDAYDGADVRMIRRDGRLFGGATFFTAGLTG
uniref:Uncharacterized protein n=1 Tax=Romanomermis culicivorax TaxID=13658 RepID=A0A915I5S4_ROMCU